MVKSILSFGARSCKILLQRLWVEEEVRIEAISVLGRAAALGTHMGNIRVFGGG